MVEHLLPHGPYPISYNPVINDINIIYIELDILTCLDSMRQPSSSYLTHNVKNGYSDKQFL